MDVILNPVNAILNNVDSEDQRQVIVVHPFMSGDIHSCNIFVLDVLGHPRRNIGRK